MTRREPGLLAPTSQMRALRELEPPSTDEGFAAVEQVPFARAPSGRGQPGVLVAAAAMRQPGWKQALEHGDRDAPHLIFDWSPGGAADALTADVARLAAEVAGPVESALCPHAGTTTALCFAPSFSFT